MRGRWVSLDTDIESHLSMSCQLWVLQGSAEPDGHPQVAHAPQAGIAGGTVMGMNPLVGHKVDRYWAEVPHCLSLACCRAKAGSPYPDVGAGPLCWQPSSGSERLFPALEATRCWSFQIRLFRWGHPLCVMVAGGMRQKGECMRWVGCRITSGGAASSLTTTASAASTGEAAACALSLSGTLLGTPTQSPHWLHICQ